MGDTAKSAFVDEKYFKIAKKLFKKIENIIEPHYASWSHFLTLYEG